MTILAWIIIIMLCGFIFPEIFAFIIGVAVLFLGTVGLIFDKIVDSVVMIIKAFNQPSSRDEKNN